MISAIISTRNRADMLRGAIASVAGQQPCSHEVEIIVVDDDSRDETESVVAAMPGVRFMRTRQGTASGTRNVGLAEAHGEWIAFLDDDDVWLPHKLRRCFEELSAKPEARVAVSQAYICDANLRRVSEWRLPDSASAPGTFDPFGAAVPTPSVMVVHREVLDRVGLFDPSVPRAEDRDMCMRIALAGYRILLVQEPLVEYRMRPKPDGEIIWATYCTTMDVLKRHLGSHATHAPGVQAPAGIPDTFRQVRGWYAHELMAASRQEADAARARRFAQLAFQVSPLHWLKLRLTASAGRHAHGGTPQ